MFMLIYNFHKKEEICTMDNMKHDKMTNLIGLDETLSLCSDPVCFAFNFSGLIFESAVINGWHFQRISLKHKSNFRFFFQLHFNYLNSFSFSFSVFSKTINDKVNLLVNVEGLIVSIGRVPQSLSGKALNGPKFFSHVSHLSLK